MGDDVKFQNPNDASRWETDGMSVLDIVKHAVKTIMHILTPDDRIALVAFDSIASLELPLTEMTESGRERGLRALDKLTPKGTTNIWGGLAIGLESLREAKMTPI